MSVCHPRNRWRRSKIYGHETPPLRRSITDGADIALLKSFTPLGEMISASRAAIHRKRSRQCQPSTVRRDLIKIEQEYQSTRENSNRLVRCRGAAISESVLFSLVLCVRSFGSSDEGFLLDSFVVALTFAHARAGYEMSEFTVLRAG